MNKQWQAFTLVEALIMLFLISLISALPIIQMDRWRDGKESHYFLQQSRGNCLSPRSQR